MMRFADFIRFFANEGIPPNRLVMKEQGNGNFLNERDCIFLQKKV